MFDGYSPAVWDMFKKSIEEGFEGVFKEKKYTWQSLIQFIRSQSTVKILTDAELRTYHHEFQAIAHYLMSNNSISEEEHNQYFWFGIHQDSWQAIEQWLTIMHPYHPRMKPYKFTDVFKAGKYVFDVNSFQNSPPEGLDAPPQLQSSPKQSQIVMRTVTFPALPSTLPVSDKFNNLVQWLRKLQVNDPEYASTYTRLVSFIPKPTVSNVFQRNTTLPCAFCKYPTNIHPTRAAQ